MADVCGDTTAGFPLGAPIAQAYSDGENFSCWLDSSDLPERGVVRAQANTVITDQTESGSGSPLVGARNTAAVATAIRTIQMLDDFEAP